MVFSSLIFLFLFLPGTLLFYFLTPNKYKNIPLFLSSVFFYTWGEGDLVVLLLLSSVINYFLGIYIEQTEKKKLVLTLALIINFASLGYYKYADFALINYNYLIEFLGLSSLGVQNLPNITLPIGISFYTFQAVSYIMDIYRKKTYANKNYIEFATYLCMFPQLVAGPIVRYIDIESQFSNRKPQINAVSSGIERFIIGLSKKVLIANTMAQIADEIFNTNISEISSPIAWLGAFAYAMQIYFDFSGYSDMAIGLGKIFGYNFPENFNYPYISKSIKEFWRRWHISLSSWFRDYLYIPLGGNRAGNFRTYINLFIVFFVTGLWHGASWNFIVWGLWHGTFLIIERIGWTKVLEKSNPFIQHLYTLIIVLIGWVIFRADNLHLAWDFINKMFSFDFNNNYYTQYAKIMTINSFNVFIAILAIVLSFPIYSNLEKRFKLNNSLDWIFKIGIIGIFLLSVIFINSSNYNPFIYFRF